MQELHEEDILLIVHYLDGELNGDDLLRFNERLETDAFFKSEIEAYQLTKKAAFRSGQTRIKAIIAEEAALYEKEHSLKIEETPQILPLVARNNWRVAATIALLISAGGLFYYLQSNKPNPEQLFAENMKDPIPNILTAELRSGGAKNQTNNKNFINRHDSLDVINATEAMTHYNANEYQESLPYFEKIKLKDDTLAMYKGYSLLKTNQTNAAQTVFLDIQKHAQGDILFTTEWYLTLTYLKQNKIEETKKSLQKILNTPNHKYHKEANQLLKQLK